MLSYNKPKLVALSTYIWCCVWLYTGKYIYLVNSTRMGHLKKVCSALLSWENFFVCYV